MPRIKNGKNPRLCTEDGCFEPRYQTSKQRYTKCEAHMRELWRKYGNAATERPAARKSSSKCPVCHRTLQEAASAGLYCDVWCNACMPICTSQASLKKHLKSRESSSYDAQKLRSQRDQLLSDLAEANRQLEALRQTAAQPYGLQVQSSDHEMVSLPNHKIIIVDYSQNCLHYLVCGQSSVRAMPPTERDLRAQLEVDIADGFLVTYTPQIEVVLP